MSQDRNIYRLVIRKAEEHRHNLSGEVAPMWITAMAINRTRPENLRGKNRQTSMLDASLSC